MTPSRKVAFHTLGCKLNFSESSALARQFVEAGYARVDADEWPDVLVVNTCSVTDDADRKCRNIISRVIRRNPGTFVAVVGCYAQLKPEDISKIEGVNLVLGANEKFNLLAQVESWQGEQKISVGEIRDVKAFLPSMSSGDRTRTFLKVQDGCNYFCSFCTIPLARGRSRSGTINQVVEQAREAALEGAREIVLTGVNIGDFGTSHGESLYELVQALEQVPGIERWRISSIEPNLLTEEIIRFVGRSKKFVPHFHIPLQSGSDDVLQGMRRRYRTDLYRSRIEAIVRHIPDACIGADVITGFPGETDDRFDETRQFLLGLPLAYLHVFTYSERDGTTALRLQEIVPQDVRHRRTIQLRLLSDKIKRSFAGRFEGSERPVLWEKEEDEGRMYGFTDNYIKVSAPCDGSLVNQVTSALLGKADADGVVACQLIRKTEEVF